MKIVPANDEGFYVCSENGFFIHDGVIRLKFCNWYEANGFIQGLLYVVRKQSEEEVLDASEKENAHDRSLQ